MDQRQMEDTAGVSLNIRYLVAQFPSISVASARLGINRQQLNKYLNGSSIPSLNTLRRFSAVFSVPTEALALPLPEMKRAMQAGPVPALGTDGDVFLRVLSGAAARSAPALAPYVGRYFRYTRIPMMPSSLLRTYAVVLQRNGTTIAKVLERFSFPGTPWRLQEIRRSQQVVTYVKDRIQTIDCGDTNDELTPGFAIFYPNYTSGDQYLNGYMLSSFSYGNRPIYTSAVVLQRLAGHRHLRSDLRACGMVPRDDPSIPAEIRDCLNKQENEPTYHLAG
ncbi:helix-turn-helix domain-containing protein [Fuscovulum blasticum]|uniref:helix-turn-helix domain-containing protein n=1 Tax=Fuscovulum blasticum TaxID=1075 RepID=UPI000D3E5416|nr:helix-turn-helix transcriptional regulator [Fuscovulum blasticum]AWD22345.1 hypothetical protein B6K69_12235 [Fuscovulum blasticum]